MDARELQEYRAVLLRKRQFLLDETLRLESELTEMSAGRQSELEEKSQDDRTVRLLAHLDDRVTIELEEVERALARMSAGLYGLCQSCGRPVSKRRLSVLPATPWCRPCAQRAEGRPQESPETGAPTHAPLPPDYGLLSDRELEVAVREQVQDDGRIDTEELRIVCRHGVVYLKGSVPSEAQHQILLHIITDVMGLANVVDLLQIEEILWEREERAKESLAPEAKSWDDSQGTDDITQAQEEEIDFVPPDRPLPDSE